jgi:hypothetical protein
MLVRRLSVSVVIQGWNGTQRRKSLDHERR